MLHLTGRLSLVLLCAAALAAPRGDREAEERWNAWQADLDYLYEEVEKPAPLKQIFKQKVIDWKALRRATDKQFGALAKAAKKRKRDDPRADEVAFYGVLHELIGQLRDSHAHVEVDPEIVTAWRSAQAPAFEAGIEFLPGTHGTILVANTFAARGANSPLRAKGVLHEATFLESIDGEPADEYFERKALEKYEQEGWQSTMQRAYVEALNDLTMAEGESLKLVFKTLDESEQGRERYLELPEKKRAKAFGRLKWDSRKVSLRANECTESQNARNFSFLALELPELTKTADLGFGRLDSGMGYIRWWKVSNETRAGLEQACAALADCPGMIVDMRLNGGGYDSGIEVFDAKDGSWDKPVAFLLGPKAMSQAETELWTLLQMREGHRVDARLFGRTTAGSSGDKVQFELPSGFAKGQFVCRHWHGGTSTIEGHGIEPDEVVDQDLVELSLGIDSCVRAAETWITDR